MPEGMEEMLGYGAKLFSAGTRLDIGLGDLDGLFQL